MLTLTAWITVTILAATTASYLWRWRVRRDRSAFGWSIVFGYGVLLYLFILSPLYELLIARYAVRYFIGLVALIHLVRNLDIITGRRK